MKSDIQLYPDLIKALEKNEIVYLFGAGFSTALSGRKYTWWDWIVDGIGRIKDHATADMLNESLMSDNSTDNMVSVVGKVIKILKEEGSYKTWMHEAFESTVVVNEKLKNTLMKILLMQDVFATTNYDHLLENATGLMAVSYEEPNVAFQMLKQGKSNNVLHIHGIYDSEKEIDNIVADKEQYDAVMNNQGAQFIQGILGTRTLIFVGCGKTTEDANISRFIQFANSHLKMNQEYYFLYREGENPIGMHIFLWGRVKRAKSINLLKKCWETGHLHLLAVRVRMRKQRSSLGERLMLKQESISQTFRHLLMELSL